MYYFLLSQHSVGFDLGDRTNHLLSTVDGLITAQNPYTHVVHRSKLRTKTLAKVSKYGMSDRVIRYYRTIQLNFVFIDYFLQH
jgi:hypothetical protein